mmetsp:Transcript_30067/g.64000  ORF Transcript_30067/g.64000 Transcript_30067/m.64000 type:complete len:209 (+) Transcript_30067:779-1405(+)
MTNVAGQVRWSGAGVCEGADRSSVGQEQCHDVLLSCSAGDMECRATVLPPDVDRGAVHEELLYRRQVALCRGAEEWSGAIRRLEVGGSPVSEERPHNALATVLTSAMQGRAAVARELFHGRPFVEEHMCNALVSPQACDDERCDAVFSGFVHIRSIFHQLPGSRGLTAVASLVEDSDVRHDFPDGGLALNEQLCCGGMVSLNCDEEQG